MTENNFSSQNNLQEQEEGLNIQDLLARCIKNWYWILISLACCLCLGILYLKRTEPSYSRSASVIIKQDSKSRTALGSDISTFSNMGLFGTQTNVYNELNSIQSPDIIIDVVKRLNLNTRYSVKKGLRNNTLYGKNLPIEIEFLSLLPNDGCSLKVKDNGDGSLTLGSFRFKKTEYSETVSTHYNDTTSTPVGLVIVRSTGRGEIDSRPISVSRSGLLNATALWIKRLSATLADKQATVINLEVNDTSKERGDDFLSTVIAVYNEKWVIDKNQIAIATSHFINERLAVIERELGNVDSDISSYKSQNLIPDIQAASNLYMKRANEAGEQILELNNMLYMARYVRKFIQNEANEHQLLPSNSGINAPAIEQQIGEYNKQLLERNRLVANSSTLNPLVIDLDKSLAAMREAILSSIDNQISSLNAQIEGYRSSEQESNSRIASNPTQAKYLLSVERQQKVKEALYLFLLQKLEENELSQAFTAYNTRVIKQPTGPIKPSAPGNMKVLLIAFILGLAIPIGIMAAAQMLNTRVRGRKDLEVIKVPIVGEIPMAGKAKRAFKLKKESNRESDKALQLLVKPQSRDIINEAFRVMRSNMEFITGMDKNNKVMMLTSANPHSGKTFITINLGSTFALNGRRTLVIDLDLRRASLSGFVGKPSKGISGVLSGRIASWRDVVLSVEGIEGMDIIPVGVLPPNPAELLYSQNLNKIISEVREEYDIILLDCPPVELVADSSIIARFADITGFVVRAGLLEREMLPNIQKMYESGRFNNMSLILNGSQASGRYGYRYGYHYGYGSDKEYGIES